MTFPISFQIGSISLSAHTIFDVLSLFIGYRFFLYKKSKSDGSAPLNPKAEWVILIGAAIGAVLGSRLIGSLENPELFFSSTNWQYYFYTKTIVGGIAGGILAVEIAKKIAGVTRRTGDIFVEPLILAIMIGRIGCLLTGVQDGTVGFESNLPWAFDQGDGINRHPTSLYEILFLLLLWSYLLGRLKLPNYIRGDLFRIFVIAYFSFRILVDFIKPTFPLILNLTSIQLCALSFVLYYTWQLHQPKKVRLQYQQ
jgi:phosphatidylglycerol:prolipoprotein diacylglycerol transferase